MLKMRQEEHEAAVAAFVRSNGVTRCPTACAVPTQGTIAPADRVALKNYAAARRRARRQKIAARERSFADRKVPAWSNE
jgi:hypothetical protein